MIPIKRLLSKAQKVLDIGKTQKHYRWINYILWAYAIVWLLYIVGWLFNFHSSGKATLSDLIALGQLMVSPAAMTAFVLFVSAKTDADKDGVPDIVEKDVRPPSVSLPNKGDVTKSESN